MNDERRTGELEFAGTDVIENVLVYWELKSGELAQGKTWIAYASFSPDYVVPHSAQTLIFKALSDPSITIKLQTDDGAVFGCVVYDILDLSDCGYIQIASPDLAGAKIIYTDDESQRAQNRNRSWWPFRRS